jgi:damage-control phosphatase, subfamily I
MKSTLDCLPCFVSQGLSVARMATSDECVQEQIMREVLRRASQADLTQSPPVFGRCLHQWVRELTGRTDPYLAVKQESNRLALALLPAWRERLRTAKNPRLTALKMAIAGNIIDYGIKGDLTAEKIPAALKRSFVGPFHGDMKGFFAAVERATEILFLADNAGELVFDRLFLELLPREKITVVVKGGPAINDALRADATVAGLDGWVPVTDTGCDGAGIELAACCPDFRERYARADLIIAKGQANFESLDGCGRDIFFLFKVKCPVVARHVGQPLGSLILHRNIPEAVEAASLRP